MKKMHIIQSYVICLPPAKAAVGHIVFVHVCYDSLGGHNLGIFYARKLKFDMLLTQT